MKPTTRYPRRSKRVLLCALGLGLNQTANAQTALQFTGLIDVYAGSLKRSGDQRTTVVNSSGLTTSWWGVKGVEDLGNNLKAQFNLTSFFRPDMGGAGRSNSDTLFARDANVGLSGSFGTVSLGRDLAPNFIPSISLNPFSGVGPFSPLMAHTMVPAGGYRNQRWTPLVAGDTDWSNEIVYTTPNVGGLTVNLFYQFGEEPGHTGKNNIGTNAMFLRDALTVGAYYQRVQVNNPVDTTTGPSQVFRFLPYDAATGNVYNLAPATRQDTWFVGGAFDFKVTKVFATYQQTSHGLGTPADDARFDLKSHTAQLGVRIPVGAGQILAAAARSDLIAHADYAALFGHGDWIPGVRRTTASAGYDYFLSRRTELYGVAMADKITSMHQETSVALGIRHRF